MLRRILVTFDGAKWRVKDDESRQDIFSHEKRTQALARALALAEEDASVHVILHRNDGTVEREWNPPQQKEPPLNG